MSTRIYFTDEDSDIEGYKRAKVGGKSDCISHVRSVTATEAGAALELPVTRAVGGTSLFGSGTTLKWVTDPLNGPALSADEWVLHAWALASNVLANAGLRVEISAISSTDTSEVVTSVAGGTSTALPGSLVEVTLTTDVATPVTMNLGDRLRIELFVVSVGTMAVGHSVTLSYNGLFARSEGDTYIVCPDNISIPEDTPDVDVTFVRGLLRDAGQQNPQLSDPEVKRHIQTAVNTYSIDRSLIVSYYLTGDGQTFDYPLPGKWIWGLSRVVAIEYPADSQIPVYQESIDYEIRQGSLGPQPTKFIRFKLTTPASDDQVWIQYTTRHEHTSEMSTIFPEDMEAVMWLAAHFAAAALAAGAAGSTESTISADVVNHRDAEQRWKSVSDGYKKMYFDRVISPDSATPVGSTEEWVPILTTGHNFLYHGRRIRRVR